MKQKNTLALMASLIIIAGATKAQWEVGMGYGVAIPYTGYGAVAKNGRLFGISGGRRFSNEKWCINFNIDWARMKDKRTTDAFENSKLDVVPMSFNLERRLGHHPTLKPYIGAGLGASIYNILYHSATKGDVSEVNASFTLAPEIGISLRTESNIDPFIQAKMIFVTDGPPIGFPKSTKATGYYGLSFGFNYLFR